MKIIISFLGILNVCFAKQIYMTYLLTVETLKVAAVMRHAYALGNKIPFLRQTEFFMRDRV